MKVLSLEAPGPIESRPLKLCERDIPEPGLGQVRIRVRACGLCHTDLHEAEGELEVPRLPIVLGHQAVGIVDSVGPRAERPGRTASGNLLKPGDRVGVPWLHETCGLCEFCKRGDENLCDDPRFTGFHADGGYGEFMLASEDFCCKLPDSHSNEQAAPLLCAGIIGLRALRAAGAARGAVLGLYGFGASAHIALQLALDQGCRVFVFSRSEEHRALALSLGAQWAGSSAEKPPAPLSCAITFAPAGSVIAQALSSLKKGGTLALAGIHIDAIPKMPYSLLYGERVLRSVTAATRDDGREFMALAARIPIRAEVRCFPFQEANDALRLLKESRINGAGVLVF